VSGLAPIMPDDADELITFRAADGWNLSGTLRRADPGRAGTMRGVVLVHGSHHARDTFVYGRALPATLAAAGIASLRFDIRGRGESRSPRAWTEMSVAERRHVALDVAAATAQLRLIGVEDGRLGVVGEQDTASSVIDAVAADEGVGGLVLLSPRLGARALDRLQSRDVPTCAMVSKEDRRALRDAAAAYAASSSRASVLHVFGGLGFGATMFMARAFEQPDEPALEDMITAWFDAVI
jgi:dienelactone hydrolase